MNAQAKKSPADRIKEWQTMIAGVSLALSLIYAGSRVAALAYYAGLAVEQHQTIMRNLNKCLEIKNTGLRQP